MQKIVYTSGDPAGIGLDIIVKAAQTTALDDLVVLADRQSLQYRAQLMGCPLVLHEADASHTLAKGELRVEHIAATGDVCAGQPNAAHAPYVLAMLDRAIDGCQRAEFSAMVTGPLNKAVINDAGIPFSGHTEYLAQKTGAPLPVMMLATEGLRVALMTTHLPLKDVSQAITAELVRQICRIVWHDLQQKFGVTEPRILLCGLNPHAGENGYLGTEEIDVIEPALAQLAADGMSIKGPLPADTLFQPHYLDDADAVIAMYHDQGLPVLKFKGFGQAANITLGLPIVRTSVDHGTAYDLAGSGQADIGSLLTALTVARQLSEHSDG